MRHGGRAHHELKSPILLGAGNTTPLAPLHRPERLRDNSAERRHALDGGLSERRLDDSSGNTNAPKIPIAEKRDHCSPGTAFEPPTPPRPFVDPASARPAHSSRDEITSDLERLEASLLWLQRKEVPPRLPRAAQLP